MNLAKVSYPLLFLILAIMLSSQCGKNCSKAIQFQIPIRILPQLETFQVNDTLWVEMNIPTVLQDMLSMESINVGYHDFQVDMNVLELLDSSWIDGTQNVQIIPSIGNVEILGVTYPEVVPYLVKFENEQIQKWKFGLVIKEPAKNLVLLFGKRDPNGWSGEYSFLESDCIYGIR